MQNRNSLIRIQFKDSQPRAIELYSMRLHSQKLATKQKKKRRRQKLIFKTTKPIKCATGLYSVFYRFAIFDFGATVTGLLVSSSIFDLHRMDGHLRPGVWHILLMDLLIVGRNFLDFFLKKTSLRLLLGLKKFFLPKRILNFLNLNDFEGRPSQIYRLMLLNGTHTQN